MAATGGGTLTIQTYAVLADQVAGTDHPCHFHPHVLHFLNSAGDGFCFRHINAKARAACQCLST